MKTRARRGLYAPELLESRIAPATFTVTSLLDNGADGTLRKEIADANAAAGTDTIVFDLANPPDPTITLNTGTGEIPITEPLTIKGPGIDQLNISGSDLIRIFNIDYTNASLIPTSISGLTLIDGKAVGAGQSGGAITSTESLTLKNIIVASSYAADDGGAVQVNTTGKVSITGSRFVDNYAKFAGGGLYIKASGLSIVKSTVSDNTSHFSAGGLYVAVSGSEAAVTINRSTFAGNSSDASDSGAILLIGEDDSKFLLKNSLITGNSADSSAGGVRVDSGNLTVAKTTFSGNTGTSGGAISDSGAKSLTITGSRFLSNHATSAGGDGGGALLLEGAAAVKITGTLFSGNSSAAAGGAISATGDTTVLNVTSSSFLGNTAGSTGGAIVLQDHAALILKGSVLSGNSAGSGGGALYASGGSSITAKDSKFTENKAAGDGGAIRAEGTGTDAVSIALNGNLFSANVAVEGGAIKIISSVAISMKGDKVLGNVADTANAGGLYLRSTADITLTGLLVQGNQAAGKAGGIVLVGDATVTGCKVRENIADVGTGQGGGVLVDSGTVVIARCTVTNNVAAIGGGIFGNGTTTIPGTKVTGNSARVDPNTSGIP